ncbi:lytic polysaccharide monooxygenase [Hypholoma sublateritium FD-334 SS-4]|uniref:lytic cellulose monooxygenase (C4-dehydrogenating) n=1 Tax=Hypholoma sublateritium (strain FD-334 SS-4) TaxID=945553 RepID=A0A0D2NW99_HYPSF|nr:lytic polysaccharide monooxygenase [Hypholoma sublateritium FD-334 SS-4]
MASSSNFLFFLSVIWIASLERVAYGHGFVHTVVIGDASYPGWNPFVDPYASPVPSRIIRKIPNDGYISIPDPDIACHHGGNNGTTAIATAPAGSQVVFQWAYWPGDHQGPVSTYMTSCGGDCSTFQANDAQWFKVDADGYDAASKQWAAAKLIANNSTWSSIIPSDLAPGQYLMRNEM